MEPALFLAGHGSRDPDGTREFLRLVDLLRAQSPGRIIECGFLEFARPVIAEGIERCVAHGAQTIAVLPGMLAQCVEGLDQKFQGPGPIHVLSKTTLHGSDNGRRSE